MFEWLKKKAKSTPAPLTGAPAVRRQKSYSALSGYVYQYYYEGQRAAEEFSEEATEYVFDVMADRKTSFPASVFVKASAVTAWESAHGRKLAWAEQYAIAKMALFQAFDDRTPAQMRAPIPVDREQVDAILDTLDSA